MSNRDFSRLSLFIEREFGIKMPAIKKTMLEGRIRKRLRYLGLESFSQYCDYIFSAHVVEDEIIHMVNAVTTNKTDFFREPQHFEYLIKTALPSLIANQEDGYRKTLMVWSAGCSSGEEPYTLAMVLTEFAEQFSGPTLNFSIIATDISTAVLDKAKQGIYEEEKIKPILLNFRKKFLMRNKNGEQRLFRIIPELRSLVKFRRLNLLEQEFDFREELNVIFCRNVLIYFERETQAKILNKICRLLCPGGFLFVGHSETLTGFDINLFPVAPTIYMRPK